MPRTPKPIEHGTQRGYQAHRRRGEKACDACKAGANDYLKARKVAREFNRARAAELGLLPTQPSSAESLPTQARPTPPKGIALAKTLSECAANHECDVHPLLDDWRDHVAIIPRLTREELLALDEEAEGYLLRWFDGTGKPHNWLPTATDVELYGFRDALLIPWPSA